MKGTHSLKWPQLVHMPVIWRCDVGHEEEVFEEEGLFNDHLDQQHSNCSAIERKAIWTSSKYSRRRSPNTCPLCCYDTSSPNFVRPDLKTQQQPLPNTTKFAESSLDILAKHIGVHLHILAVKGTENIGVDSDDFSQKSLKTDLKTSAGSRKHPQTVLKGTFEPSVVVVYADDNGWIEPTFKTGIFDKDWSSDDLLELENCLSSPKQLSSDDFVDWYGEVIPNLKEKMDYLPRSLMEDKDKELTAPSDKILKHLCEHQGSPIYQNNLSSNSSFGRKST